VPPARPKETLRPARRRLVPLGIESRRLGIDGPVVPVRVVDGTLEVPPDPHVLGWWQHGAAVGEPGTVVIVGHVDSAELGPGSFFNLGRAKPGDRITVSTAAGSRRYVVAARRAFPKGHLPPDAFAPTGRPRLVLITCGGPFDTRTRHYRDNVVVYAVPLA
jgi:hypothetical protein